MKSLRLFDSRAGSLLSAGLLLAVTVAPSLVFTSNVYADLITSRSVKLSSSAKSATSVEYTVTFTPKTAAGVFEIDFCNDSPIIGGTCTAPAGFDTSSVATSTASTTVAATNANSSLKYGVKVTSTLTANSAKTVVLTGITNPNYATDTSANGGFYARIVTYTDASAYTAQYTSPSSLGTYNDAGGAAMAITENIGVSAAVRETLTFCVSGADTSGVGKANCAGVTNPSLTLGETSGAAKALSPSAVSTGIVYTQLSTNAVSGAVVNLKSSATSCGGLVRSGAANCDIVAAASDISAGEAKFGVKTGTAVSSNGVTGTGTYQAAGSYNSSTYFMNYVAGNATGVTSTYGDPILNTNGAPVNNMNMPLTFGASISNNTPAGLYSATLSMIATGTY